MSTNNDKLKVLISKVLNISEKAVTDETSPESTHSWDSFNGLVMVSELEDSFNVHFTMEEVLTVTCVKDIREALMRHGVEFR